MKEARKTHHLLYSDTRTREATSTEVWRRRGSGRFLDRGRRYYRQRSPNIFTGFGDTRRRHHRYFLLSFLFLAIVLTAGGIPEKHDKHIAGEESLAGEDNEYPDCKGIYLFFGDGDCDDYNNNALCGWDGGDCCECTCTDSPNYTCGDASHGGFYCVDPNSGCQDATNAPTSTPDPGQVLTAPDCFGTRDFIGDGYCDENNNNEGCEYDGGDCCSCTCSHGPRFSCDGSFDCKDPNAHCSQSTSDERWLIMTSLLAIGVLICVLGYQFFDCFTSWRLGNEGVLFLDHPYVDPEETNESPLPPAQ